MASTYSSLLRIELIGNGEQSNTWGATTNTNLGTLIDKAIAGTATVTVADSGDTTLTTANGADDQARCAALKLTGALTAARTVICPSLSKLYAVQNGTTGGFAVTVKTSGGAGTSVPNGTTMFLYCDGSTVIPVSQPYSVSLAGLASLATNGFVARTGAGTYSARTLTTGAGISITNGDGVSGNPVIVNSGVTSLIAGAGISLSSSTGTVTITSTGAPVVAPGSWLFLAERTVAAGNSVSFAGELSSDYDEFELVSVGTNSTATTTTNGSMRLVFSGGNADSSSFVIGYATTSPTLTSSGNILRFSRAGVRMHILNATYSASAGPSLFAANGTATGFTVTLTGATDTFTSGTFRLYGRVK